MAGKMTLYKVVVLGDGGVGKTSLRIQLCLQHFFETYDPTMGDSYRKQVQIDGQSCMLEVLDTAGQEEYTALGDQLIRDGEGFVLVYSISSRSSFAGVQKFHNQIRRVKEKLHSEQGSIYPGSPLSASSTNSGISDPPPIMLVGNKCDRVTEREVSTREGYALARELSCDFVETSAKNCITVEKAFYDVVRQLHLQRSQVIAARHKPREDIRNKPSPGSNVKTAKPGGSSKSSDSYRSFSPKIKCIVL